MLVIEIMIALVLAGAFIHFQVTKRRNNYETALLAKHAGTSEELKRTLAMGLYERFKEIQLKETEEKDDEESPLSPDENQATLEMFTAQIMQTARGGNTWITSRPETDGVDFEHEKDDYKALGQVECTKSELGYESVAILHSKMVKQDMERGYLISTGSFTDEAKIYADSLPIELIDGSKLVDLWISALQDTENEIRKMLPEYA